MSIEIGSIVQAFVECGLIDADHAAVLGDCLSRDDLSGVASMATSLTGTGAFTEFQAQVLVTGEADRLLIGPYLLIEPIGAGGMGQVYKAIHRKMRRVVAIKTLMGKSVESRLAVERFGREVRVAARLKHRNIVTAFDAGEHGGQPFFAMEYVAGRDLSALVKHFGPLPLERAVDHVTQIASGLAYAHGQGVIHRDIKPANLLLDEQGTVKILDMGLARFVTVEGETSAVTALTGMDDVMGTIDYMSPEQAVNTHQADARSDVYSLGCTLWYLLIGEPPYHAESTMNRLLAHRRQPIPSLIAARPEVPSELDAIFQKMVAKDPADRFQAMNEVVVALGACPLPAALNQQTPPLDDALLAWLRVRQTPGDTLVSSRAGGPTAETLALRAGQQPDMLGGQRGSAPARRGRYRVIAVAIAALLFLVLAVVRPWASAARLELDLGQPGATVRVLNGDGGEEEILASAPARVSLGLDAGPYRVEVRRGDALVLEQDFRLVEGQILRIEASADGPLIAQRDSYVAPDRAVMRWICEMGGNANVILEGGHPTNLQGADKDSLPVVPFKIVLARLPGNATLLDGDLRRLVVLEGLSAVELSDAPGITDSAIDNLKKLPELTELVLVRTRLTDAGLRRLSELPKLTRLTIAGDGFTDAGLTELACLSELTALSVSGQQFTDKGISRLGSLSKLTNLSLTGTSVTVEGLGRLASLAELEGLNLQSTGIDDAAALRLAAFPKLRTLNLGNTRITDACAPLFARLPQLETVQLTEAAIGDPLLKQLVGCSKLSAMNLVGTRATDDGLAQLHSLKQLTYLGVSPPITPDGIARLKRALPDCGIDPATLDPDYLTAQWVVSIGGKVSLAIGSGERTATDLADLPNGGFTINEIDLAGSKQASAGMARLATLPRLRRLELHHSDVTDDDLAYLRDATSLQMLSVETTAVTDQGLTHLRDLTSMQVLNLMETGLTDAGLDHLAAMTDLRHLKLTKTSVTDDGLKKMLTHPALEELVLHGTAITDVGLRPLTDLEKLVSLDLNETAVTDEGLDHLVAMISLRHLQLSNTKVTDDGMRTIAAHPALEGLSLKSTPITDAGLLHLTNLKKLVNLNLEATQVTDDGVAALQAALPGCTAHPIPHFDAEHRAARWITSLGGTSLAYSGDKLLHIEPAHEISGGGFAIVDVTLSAEQPMADAGLRRLTGLPNLRNLTLGGPGLTDRALGDLERLAGLTSLSLARTSISDAILEKVGALLNLESLDLRGTRISDVGLDHLRGLSKLRELNLEDTGVSPAGEARLQHALPKCQITRFVK